MVMMAAVMTGCAQQKALVLYYSETGTTKIVAQEMQKQLQPHRVLAKKLLKKS